MNKINFAIYNNFCYNYKHNDEPNEKVVYSILLAHAPACISAFSAGRLSDAMG